ncbi:hypothetical protein [Pseudomonas protegens]|uniref:hypothetical protein n=1 Tax=Pseudomonas protegens TaxID=380021 RepID=UPI00301E2BD5
MTKVARCSVSDVPPVPLKVFAAKRIQWGVMVDAYLTNAAKVGTRYSAMAFSDRSGLIQDGETVATPPAKVVDEQQGFVLLQSFCGGDHYVVVSWLEASAHPST